MLLCSAPARRSSGYPFPGCSRLTAGVTVASDFSLIVNVLSQYFVQNFKQIFSIIFIAGIILGGLSSYIAARRYLKV
jgi:hypothetical protein